jgi:uncharacterized alkaline shock family protein YloU
MYKETTEFGTIKISDSVPGSAVKRVVANMEGRVLLSTPKGRQSGDEHSFIVTEYADGRVDITLYIILRFGVSIQTVARELADGVRAEIPRVLGISPNLIRIVITGLQARNLSRRNIVVETYADADAE